GAILDGNDVPSGTAVVNVTADMLALSASTGIGVASGGVSAADAPLETQVNSVEAQTSTGGVFLSNGVTAPVTLSGGGGSASLSGVRVTGGSGDIRLVNNGGIDILTHGDTVSGPAGVDVEALGPTADLRTGGDNGGISHPGGGLEAENL